MKNNVNLFLNLSSIDVYGEVNKKLLTESYRPKNVNPYGKIKGFVKIERKNKLFKSKITRVLCDPSINNLERTGLILFSKIL